MVVITVDSLDPCPSERGKIGGGARFKTAIGTERGLVGWWRWIMISCSLAWSIFCKRSFSSGMTAECVRE